MFKMMGSGRIKMPAKGGWNVGLKTEVSRRQCHRRLKSFQVIFLKYIFYTFLYYRSFYNLKEFYKKKKQRSLDFVGMEDK